MNHNRMTNLYLAAAYANLYLLYATQVDCRVDETSGGTK